MAEIGHFLVRFLHVVGMAILFGGAGWTWNTLRESDEVRMRPLIQFEWVFWVALGLMLATGVGNLGAVGAPGPSTFWGTVLTLKLLIVVVFVVGSFLRTLCVTRLREQKMTASYVSFLRLSYAGTAGMVLLIVALAEVLAHG